MRYDIVIVSYNSERWLPNCIGALAKLDYDLAQLHLIVVDNGSRPECLQLLHQLQQQYPCFGEFTVHPAGKNLGFGRGCNLGASLGDSPYVFMLNVDTEIFPDALTELDKAIAQNDGTAGAFELRQLPLETGHHHDPVTMETDWNSGACVVYPRQVFELVEGFDENIFLYCEDVDISWRIRACGYKLLFVPRAATYHFTRQPDPTKEKEFREYAWTQYTKLMLHYKYGDFVDRHRARVEYLNTLAHPKHYDYVRRILLKNFLHHFLDAPKFLAWRRTHRELLSKVPVTYTEGFTTMRSLYTYTPLTQTPLVSVIIRAYRNPNVLRETLKSLRHQTYRNFEIVLQEDGPESLRTMIETEFPDLPISYEATGVNVGRSKAGNRALQRSKGKYINFLDSDDFFYPEHLELMMATFQNHPDADIVLSGCMRYDTDIQSTAPEYRYKRVQMVYVPPVDITLPVLCHSDPIPILTATFRRELYEQKGGLREDIETNEDWAMWLRFFTLNPKVYTNARATCAFIFPYNETVKQKKLDSYHVNHNRVYEDESLVYSIPASELRYHTVPADKGLIVTHLPIFPEQDMEGESTDINATKEDLSNGLIKHDKELRKTAKEIASSTSWKITAPLRAIAVLLYLCVLFLREIALLPVHILNLIVTITNAIFNFIRKFIGVPYILLDKLLRFCHKLRDHIGPRHPDFDDDPIESIYSFVLLSRRSVSWKVANRLLHHTPPHNHEE